jgi:tetratricopeptide (TPR) repeat protein
MLLWKGNLDEAYKPAEYTTEEMGYIEGNILYLQRQFDKLLQTAKYYEDQFDYRPRSLNLAIVNYLSSNAAQCKLYADSAITEIELLIKESPDDDRYYAALAYANGFAGDKKKAMENISKAVKLKPLTLDAWQGFKKELDLAKIYILTGENDLAMDKIEYLLTIPGELSVPLLKLDPAVDKLRSLPRFQKILKTEYKTIY